MEQCKEEPGAEEEAGGEAEGEGAGEEGESLPATRQVLHVR